MNKFMERNYNLCVWVTKFAYLNLLWFIFTIIGGGILGIMPSTAAMFAVARKWLEDEKEISTYKTFWKSYRQEFFNANLLGYTTLLIGYVLFMGMQILRAQENLFYYIISFGILGLFLMYVITLLYLFPIFVNFKLKIFQNIKWAFMVGIAHPFLTIILATGILIIHFVIFSAFPAVFFMFGMSSSAFILMWGSSQLFHRLEQNKKIILN